MFGEELARKRKAAGLTQMDLARAAGTSQARISSYESGHVQPSAPTRARLDAALGPRPSELLDRNRRALIDLAADHGLTNVRVFGSIAKAADQPDSDVDLVVTAAPGTGLVAVSKFALAAEKLLGCPVDVVTDGGLDPSSSVALEALAV